MRSRPFRRQVLLFVHCVVVAAWAFAGEAPKGEPPKPPPLDIPMPDEQEQKVPDEPDGWVDTRPITRADPEARRVKFLFEPRPPTPAPEPRPMGLPAPPTWLSPDLQAERRLLEDYFRKERLLPSGADIMREIQRQDAELRKEGSSYAKELAALGVIPEEHATMIAFELSKARWVARIQRDIRDDEVKAEFEAHPEWYDGSAIRISQIFIETADLRNDEEMLKKARDKIWKVHAQLVAVEDFDLLPREYCDGRLWMRGGDLGWRHRWGGSQADEPLIAAAWALKPGEFTKPIQSIIGWHILKVTDRRPARLTAYGARPNAMAELVRRRQVAVLDQLRAKVGMAK